MYTNFGWPGLFGFEDFAPLRLLPKQPNFPFEPWAIVHGRAVDSMVGALIMGKKVLFGARSARKIFFAH